MPELLARDTRAAPGLRVDDSWTGSRRRAVTVAVKAGSHVLASAAAAKALSHVEIETDAGPLSYEPPAWSTSPGTRYIVGVCGFALLAWYAYISAFTPIMPELAEEHGWHGWRQGGLLAVVQVGFILGFLVLQLLPSSAEGRREVLLWAAGSWIVAPLLMIARPECYRVVFLAQLIAGAGAAVILNFTMSAMIKSLPPRRLGGALGARMLIGAVGMVNGPVASFIVPRAGLHGLGCELLVVGILVFFVLATMPQELLVDDPRPARKAGAGAVGAGAGMIILISLVQGVKDGFFQAAVPELLQTAFGLGTMVIAIFLLWTDALRVGFAPVGGWLADQTQFAPLVFGSLLAVPVALLCLAFSAGSRTALLASASVLAALGLSPGSGLSGPGLIKLLVLRGTPSIFLFSVSDLATTLGLGSGMLLGGLAGDRFREATLALAAVHAAVVCAALAEHVLQTSSSPAWRRFTSADGDQEQAAKFASEGSSSSDLDELEQQEEFVREMSPWVAAKAGTRPRVNQDPGLQVAFARLTTA